MMTLLLTLALTSVAAWVVSQVWENALHTERVFKTRLRAEDFAYDRREAYRAERKALLARARARIRNEVSLPFMI